jgi:glycosyltransferase involved in cell wall biosynthesis
MNAQKQQDNFQLTVSLSDIIETQNIFNGKVSCIIPTKNAGSEFNYVLKKLLQQQGLNQLEIIVVDSGSTDETLKIAKKHRTRIFHIDPKSFNHGIVRNFGAARAKGDYLIFMSQDAIPIGDFLICDLVKVMEEDKEIAGSTVKQVPRSDADLFACWQLWYYYNKLMQITDNHIVQASKHNFKKLEPTETRKMAQLDNVFSCVRKDIFDNFLFKELQYAEDLDLGLRLLQKGYKLAFLFSHGVVHSHNRSPDYFFKRSYIDWISLFQILKFKTRAWNKLDIGSLEDILSLIYWFYCLINILVDEIKKEALPQNAEIIFSKIRGILSKTGLSNSKTNGNKDLDRILKKLISNPDNLQKHKALNMLRHQYIDLMNSFEEFISVYKDIKFKKEELIAALYKFFAIVTGTNMADFIEYAKKYRVLDSQEELLNRILKQGI